MSERCWELIQRESLSEASMQIRGEYAKELREILRRVYSGKLNEQDLELIRKHKEILKDWNIVWK